MSHRQIQVAVDGVFLDESVPRDPTAWYGYVVRSGDHRIYEETGCANRGDTASRIGAVFHAIHSGVNWLLNEYGTTQPVEIHLNSRLAMDLLTGELESDWPSVRVMVDRVWTDLAKFEETSLCYGSDAVASARELTEENIDGKLNSPSVLTSYCDQCGTQLNKSKCDDPEHYVCLECKTDHVWAGDGWFLIPHSPDNDSASA